MTVRWHPAALAEAAAVARFYRGRHPHLADRFINSLEEALHRAVLHPRIYREIDPGVRKCRLKTFPHALIFREAADIQVLAVMHLRREPGYWVDRT